jgi:YVTN family beta-propeller protein
VPPLPVSLTIQAAIPWLGADGRAVISVLVAANGQIASATVLAARLRIGSRFRLARVLRQEGLPPFGRLADWICVLQIMWEEEAMQRPLHGFARRIGIEPATCYRRCKRTLGVPWSVARENGFGWALVKFLDHCRRPRASHGGHRVPGLVVRASERGSAGQPIDARRASGSTVSRPTGVANLPSAATPFPQQLARIELGQAPTDAAISSAGGVYVCRAFASVVDHIDLRTLQSVASIPVGSNPTRIVCDPPGRRAFVSNQFGGSISVIDTTTDSVVDEIAVAGDPAPVLVAPNGRTLFVTTNLDRLLAIDLASKRLVAETTLPATSHNLTLHPDRRQLYVATRLAGAVLELDPETLRVLRSFALGGKTQAMALEPVSGELYVANEAGWLDVVKLKSGERTASLRLDGGGYGVSLSPNAAWLYATVPAVGRVCVVDRASLRLIHTIWTGGSPRHTIFARDGRAALVVNEAGWVDVLN